MRGHCGARDARFGTIAGDGAFTGKVGDGDARGKFSGDAFEGDYEFGACTMLMRLTRPL